MSARLVAIPDRLLRGSSPIGHVPGSNVVSNTSGQWKDANGNNLGPSFFLPEAKSAYLEFPDVDGRLQHTEVVEPPALASEPPPEAAYLQLSGENAPIRISRAELFEAPAQLGPPQIEFVGSEQARFIMPVFAERFSRWDDFIPNVRSLYEWISAQKPFDSPALRAQLALKAQFWPSDPVQGMFNTPDSAIQDGRLFYGDRVLAKTLLDPWIAPSRVSLILIKSTLRGGAGGTPGYSAWTSITAAPGEAWQAVCLHEIGHGLGLADEYVDSNPVFANQWPAHFEPNVSPTPQPSKTSWSALATLADNPAPSFTDADESGPMSQGVLRGRSERSKVRATDRMFIVPRCVA